MNWLDLVLLIILAVSMITSFRKGLSREVIGLISVVLALLLGAWLYGTAGAFLRPYVSSQAAANLGGFLLVFVAVVLLGSLVSFILRKFLRVTGLSFLDHLLGAGFGFVRGMVIAIALVMGIMAFSPGERPPSAVLHSRLAPYVVDAAKVASTLAPHELKEGFRKSYEQLKTAWGEVVEKKE